MRRSPGRSASSRTRPVVGYISSFTGYEGIAYLIEAVAAPARARAARPPAARRRWRGPGQPGGRRGADRVAGGRDGRSSRAGSRTREIERYYRTIDVFVVPRTNDRVSQLVTPLKPYEAMAMEKALVVSAVGALLEIVEEDVTGLTFTPEDPVSLADVRRTAPRRPGERGRPWARRRGPGSRPTGPGSRTAGATWSSTSGWAWCDGRHPPARDPRRGALVSRLRRSGSGRVHRGSGGGSAGHRPGGSRGAVIRGRPTGGHRIGAGRSGRRPGRVRRARGAGTRAAWSGARTPRPQSASRSDGRAPRTGRPPSDAPGRRGRFMRPLRRTVAPSPRSPSM